MLVSSGKAGCKVWRLIYLEKPPKFRCFPDASATVGLPIVNQARWVFRQEIFKGCLWHWENLLKPHLKLFAISFLLNASIFINLKRGSIHFPRFRAIWKTAKDSCASTDIIQSNTSVYVALHMWRPLFLDLTKTVLFKRVSPYAPRGCRTLTVRTPSVFVVLF